MLKLGSAEKTAKLRMPNAPKMERIAVFAKCFMVFMDYCQVNKIHPMKGSSLRKLVPTIPISEELTSVSPLRFLASKESTHA